MKRITKLIVLWLMCIFTVAGSASAQTTQITGKVLDELDQGVIGATVRLKTNASVGATTDLDGNFTIKAKA